VTIADGATGATGETVATGRREDAHLSRDAAAMRTGAVQRAVDVLIIGAGPAGLSCAAELARSGAGSIEVVEREAEAGGIPRHTAHTGFGIRDRHRCVSGPRYAQLLAEDAARAGALVRTSASATGWPAPLTLDVTSPAGLEQISAGAVVLATGARERPRAARLIPGDRPDGIYTTALLQQAALAGQRIGTRALVVGAEHVSYSAAVTLDHAGVRVVAMVTELPRQQSYVAFGVAAAARYRFPVICDATVIRIGGRGRVSSVEVRRPDGRTRQFDVDTVVLTGDWIGDHELARRAGLAIDPGTRGPAVDMLLATSQPGVFAAGNLIHPVETADAVALEGGFVAGSVLAFLAGAPPAGVGSPRVPVVAEAPLRWVAPNVVIAGGGRPHRDRVLIWSDAFVAHPRLRVRQGERQLAEITAATVNGLRSRAGKLPRTLVPNRPVPVDARWISAVDPDGPAVTLGVS
jgi:thioredoxin reductase